MENWLGDSKHSRLRVGVDRIGVRATRQEKDRTCQGQAGSPRIAPRAIRPRHFWFLHSEAKHGDEGKRVVGDEEKRQHVDYANKFLKDAERHTDSSAQGQGQGWCATLIHPGCGAEEQSIAA